MGRLTPAALMSTVALALSGSCALPGPGGPTLPPVAQALGGRDTLDTAKWRVFRAAISPDGRNLAFLGMMGIGTFRLARVTNGSIVPLTPGTLDVSDFAWMPDSASLLVASHVGQSETLAIYGLDGVRRREIAADRAFANDFENGMTVRSDGSVAVVSAMPPGDEVRPGVLLEVNLTSGGTRALIAGDGFNRTQPVYVSPDRLVYVEGKLDVSPGTLYELTLSTGQRRRLSTAVEAVGVVSGAEGSRTVIYTSESSGTTGGVKLMAVDLGSGGRTPLTARDVSRPALDPSGKWFVATDIGTPSERGHILRLLQVK
jgi:hypothetical protein